MVPSLPQLSCESSVSVKENPEKKKDLLELLGVSCIAFCSQFLSKQNLPQAYSEPSKTFNLDFYFKNSLWIK